jgi:hypothetical protein
LARRSSFDAGGVGGNCDRWAARVLFASTEIAPREETFR